MAAGQGFKTFTTGEVLTAGDVNGYLMQGINVFATTTARDAAITAPAEGQFAFTKDTNSLWYYDGAAWVASGATGDIEGVTAGVGISGGGTSGTVTITNAMATEIAAKGDLIVGTGSQTFDNLTVGANDTVLTADSSTATGLKWATPAASADIPLSTVTTAGDLIYATGAGAVTRRGIGSTGNVLTVSGGVPTWAAPAGGAKSYSLRSTTTLTGASTITVSSLGGYDDLVFLISDWTSNTASSQLQMRFNSDSGSNYTYNGFNTASSSTYDRQMINNLSGTQTYIVLGTLGTTTGAGLNGGASVRLSGANSTGFKAFTALSGTLQDSGSSTMSRTNNSQGMWTNAAQITSVSVISSAGNFNGGTIRVYAAV
jgi:trimeric autotransporter adhesin